MFRRTIAALVAAICLVAGCSGSHQQNGAPERLPATDIIRVNRGDVGNGGILHLATPNFPGNFNFQRAGTAGLPALSQTTLPHFFTFDAEGNPVLDTDYATSAKVTSLTPFTVTYDINPRAVWSDGTPIRLQDLYNDWRANRDSRFGSSGMAGFGNITSVTQGVNDHQVRVTYNAPYAAWRQVFNDLPPASLTADPRAFNTLWRSRPLLSAGPFIVTSVDPKTKVITEKRNPRWWGQKPKLSEVVIRACGEAEALRAYVEGKLDALDVAGNAAALRRAAKVHDTTILRAAGASRYVIDLNAASPYLTDVRVRRAILQSIDRRRIAASRLAGLGVPVSVLNNLVYSSTQGGYADDATAEIAFNQAAARQNLDAAGWRLSGGVRKKNGQELRLRMVVVDSEAKTAEQIKKMLRDVGIVATIQKRSTNDLGADDFEIAYFVQPPGGPYPECNYGQFYPANGAENQMHISTTQIGDLFHKACATLAAGARRVIANVADQRVFHLAAMATVYMQPNIGAVRSTLANYDADSSAFQSPDWVDVGFRK